MPAAILTEANAVMTPLTHINAPRTTGINRDDVVEIATKEATKEALNAQIDGGSRCTSSSPASV